MPYCTLKITGSLLALLLFTSTLFAQKMHKGQLAVATGPLLPAGRLAGSHWIGGGISASPATNRAAFNSQHQLFFTWQGGLVYFAGKKVTVAGYPYTYPGFAGVYAMAGGMYGVLHKTAVSLCAGPAVTNYNGATRFNIGAALDIDYYINKQWAVRPGISMLKESGAGPYWFASLKAVLVL